MATKILKGINFPGLKDTYIIPEAAIELDSTLTEAGKAADAAAVGERFDSLDTTIAVDENSDGNIEIRSYLPEQDYLQLDKSLTVEGAAADAKVTGDALAGKAPAGYGLGGAELKAWADVDSLTKPGFYKFSDCELNDGLAAMIVHASDDWTLAQELITFSYPTRKYTRSCHGGSWREWENDALKPYPIGAVYISTVYASPASLFGGTWESITDRFLLASGYTYAAGTTGGEATHTLTNAEVPSTAVTSDMYSMDYRMGHTVSSASGEPGFAPVNGFVSGTSRSHTIFVAGGDGAHNNMPPYLCVYMWKRVA